MTTHLPDNSSLLDVLYYNNRQAKNRGADGGSWCEREYHEEAGEELAKVGWTCGQNGRGQLTNRADALSVEG